MIVFLILECVVNRPLLWYTVYCILFFGYLYTYFKICINIIILQEFPYYQDVYSWEKTLFFSP